MIPKTIYPVLLPAFFLSATGTISAQKCKKPNIIIVLADDLGWGDVGYHGSNIRTPNLDQLAANGIRMNRFYTAPVSSPTRAGLLTGRYPNRFGLRETVIPPWRDFGLDTEEELLPEMLEKAGYTDRAIIGKWHLGHSRKAYYPLNRGFTYFYGHLNGAIDYFTHKREGELDWHRNWDTAYDEGYSTDLITKEAVNCIGQYSQKEDPFFLYVAYNAPHAPLQAKPEDIALYTDDPELLSPKERKKAIYAAMVTCMDRGIGEIWDALKANGIEENTLFIFFSDNGAEPNGGGTNQPLKGTKFEEWDGGVRTPAIISYPELFEGHREIDQVTGFVDIMPTIRSILCIRDKAPRPFDGIDISPVLSGKKETIRRDLYLGGGAIVNNDYKLIIQGKNDRIKTQKDFLVYYPDDAYEKKNAGNEHPKELKRLNKIAEKYDAIKPPFNVLPYHHGRENFVAPSEWKVTK
ncbi:MAG: arylsulfatase [Bacteroidales bacterium]|jgi:arylsulfatase B|nr:arylsulfatase [Bacteroidales bacterium]